MNKKFKNYFNKSITSILILSTLALPFFDISKAYAQVQGGYDAGGGYSSETQVSGGIGGYIQVLTPAIQELPLCREKIANSKIKNLFGNNTYTFKDGKIESARNAKARAAAAVDSESIPVSDVGAREEIKNTNQELGQVKESVSALEENDSCLKSIGRMVTKILLQKITLSTVEWINTGFEGKPLFLQDPGKFFGDIATTEILQFRAEIDNPTLYPFGRDFLKAQVSQINRRFAQNARYSANELIAQTTPEYSAATFSTDFSKGGWNAWTAITQVPANNPIGFQVIASNELSLRLAGTSASNAERKQQEIQQSEGFLGVERCVEAPNITKSAHLAALERNQREKISVPYYIDNEKASNNPDDQSNIAYQEIDKPNGQIIGTCPGNRWEYVTPGKTISEFATKIVNYPDNNILRADDLNAAIATIMDAALNKFIPDLANKGLALLGTEGRDGSYIIDGSNRTTGGYSQTELDFPKTALGTNWLKENYNFNIRTGLTQAVIDEQRIYQRKLLEENKILDDLITTVYQLDYCIPGPHPGFEEDSRRTLAAVKNTIVAKTPTDFINQDKDQVIKLIKTGASLAGAAIGASIGTAVLPIVGTAIGAAIGVVAGLIIDLLDKKDEYELTDIYYGLNLKMFTGIRVNAKNTKFALLRTKQSLTNVFDTILERYIELIHKYYTPEFLPTIAPTAAIEFNKIPGYRKTIENNEYASNILDGVIVRLAKLKDQLDTMNPEQNSYAEYLPLINEFSRLSASMVTGNDIAKIVDSSKEYSSQIKYVYDDLLKGPFGCEKDLETNRRATPGQTIQLRQTKRAEYPFKKWYDYNTLASGTVIPVPEDLFAYNITIKAPTKPGEPDLRPRMPSQDTPYGPGFLSRVAFDFTAGDPGVTMGCEALRDAPSGGDGDTGSYANILDCIVVSDTIYNVNSWPVSVGRNKLGPAINGQTGAKVNEQRDSSFEQTIGIY